MTFQSPKSSQIGSQLRDPFRAPETGGGPLTGDPPVNGGTAGGFNSAGTSNGFARATPTFSPPPPRGEAVGRKRGRSEARSRLRLRGPDLEEAPEVLRGTDGGDTG